MQTDLERTNFQREIIIEMASQTAVKVRNNEPKVLRCFEIMQHSVFEAETIEKLDALKEELKNM